MAHLPAWYRDPKDPTRVRRWDGAAWTDEVRPIPEWLRTVQVAAGPVSGRRRSGWLGRGSSRRLWWTSSALLGLGAVVMIGLGSSDDGAPRLQDTAFTRAADERCAATGRTLGEATKRRLEGDAEVSRIESITTAWEATAADLRALPVAPADARLVEQWLTIWDRWVALGHEYADALAAGDEARADAVLDDAVAPKADLSRFARFNGMDDCAFR